MAGALEDAGKAGAARQGRQDAGKQQGGCQQQCRQSEAADRGNCEGFVSHGHVPASYLMQPVGELIIPAVKEINRCICNHLM